MPTEYQRKPSPSSELSRRGRVGRKKPFVPPVPQYVMPWELALDRYLSDPLGQREELTEAVRLMQRRGER